MSKLDNRLAAFGDEFRAWFEDDLRITNYEAVATTTTAEEFDDPDEKQPTADSPISTTGQIDLRGTAESAIGEGAPWGRDIALDVEIWLDSGETVSDGEVSGLPYASDIEHVPTGRRFRVSAIHEEGDELRVAATRLREHHD